MKRQYFVQLLAGLIAATITGCGDSGPRACVPVSGNICSIAGTGVAGLTPDGLDPRKTELYLPQDQTIGPDGNLYILDWNNHRIRVIRDGVVETVVGTGQLGDAPDGPALAASLNHPTHVAFAADGSMIIAAWHNSKIIRYDPTRQTIETICGDGSRAFNGDGRPATATVLDLPVATAVRSDGGILISDQANQRIRLLDATGTVTTVAGTGTPGYSGDGASAVSAQINLPVSQSAPPAGRIELAADGSIVLADSLNHVIRWIDPNGVITTVAGTGAAGTGGPTGSGTSIALNTPGDVAVAADGTVFIADTLNSCVRRLDPAGQMTTVAGQCGQTGFAGDHGPAAQALLDRPYGVEVATDGTLYIADSHNHRIRVVHP